MIKLEGVCARVEYECEEREKHRLERVCRGSAVYGRAPLGSLATM